MVGMGTASTLRPRFHGNSDETIKWFVDAHASVQSRGTWAIHMENVLTTVTRRTHTSVTGLRAGSVTVMILPHSMVLHRQRVDDIPTGLITAHMEATEGAREKGTSQPPTSTKVARNEVSTVTIAPQTEADYPALWLRTVKGSPKTGTGTDNQGHPSTVKGSTQAVTIRDRAEDTTSISDPRKRADPAGTTASSSRGPARGEGTKRATQGHTRTSRSNKAGEDTLTNPQSRNTWGGLKLLSTSVRVDAIPTCYTTAPVNTKKDVHARGQNIAIMSAITIPTSEFVPFLISCLTSTPRTIGHGADFTRAIDMSATLTVCTDEGDYS